ncbi:MAG: GMC family oxidoreductase [Acetobacteraceae bacterium]
MESVDIGTWDHIVIGAGSAGCAVAARLSAEGRTVLVLEAGGEEDHRWLRIPLGIGKVIHDERFVWQFRTEPEAAAGARSIYWPRGKGVGGSSSVNGMIWVRGDPNRYDEWAATGCPGWGWSSLEPVLCRIENFRIAKAEGRGINGPISIEMLGENDPITDAFIAACNAAGIPTNPDYNGLRHEGVGRLQVTTRKGVRCSAAIGYLRPAFARSNLKVETRAFVRRIVFANRRATGVEFLQNGGTRYAAARYDVILAAGAIQSPQILELSGIGGASRLKALAVPVVVDLPGVGENLSDHYHIRVTYRSRGVVTVNDLVNHPLRYGLPTWLQYQIHGTGLLAGVSATAHALARTAPDSPYPDTKLQIFKISAADLVSTTRDTGLDAYSGVSLGFFQLYPESRGSVHAVSPDPRRPPRIIANYLSTPRDRALALRGLRLARRVGAHPAMRRFLVEEVRPGPSVGDDTALLDYVARVGQTSYHPVGTCHMGTDRDAVVDPDCRVRGVDSLRVVDASVMPFIVSSNTNAPSIAIGERAAEVILQQANS